VRAILARHKLDLYATQAAAYDDSIEGLMIACMAASRAARSVLAHEIQRARPPDPVEI
jgi:hypothetical protein